MTGKSTAVYFRGISLLSSRSFTFSPYLFYSNKKQSENVHPHSYIRVIDVCVQPVRAGVPPSMQIRDWSLITGKGGGLQNGRGGMLSLTPTKRVRGAKSFSHAEGGGGHNKFWGSFYAVA